MKIMNINGNEPCIIHIPGQTRFFYEKFIFPNIGENLKFNFEDLTVVFCETNYDLVFETSEKYQSLLWQLNNYNIPYINGWENTDYKCDGYFELGDKIVYILNALKQVKTKYTIILDSRDIKINTFDNIIEKFLSYNTRILFSAEKFQFPYREDRFIKQEHQETFGSNMKYCNVGGIIGYTKDLLDFYTKATKKYLEEGVPYSRLLNQKDLSLQEWYGTDQAVIIDMLKDYDLDYINVDYKSLIFLTISYTNIYIN